MSNLGKLWFELGLKDNTDKDIKSIRANVEKRLKELGVDVKITPDLSGLKGVEVEIKTDTSKVINDVQAALKAANIEIEPKLSIDKAMSVINGPRSVTVDTGAFARIETLLNRQREAAGGAADALSSYQRTFEAFSKKATTASGSIKAMEAELNKLRDTYRSLSEADRNSAIGKGLLQQINNADEALAKVNSEMANNAALAKAMGTRYNGLQMQLAQVARELPNFALSFSTGVISLSNNLPMLADDIARVRQEVELAKKSGQTVAPVWKQILAGLLNWQSALIVGITVLVAYSDEIAKWVEGLFKGDSALRALRESIVEFNSEMIKSESEVNALFEALDKITEGTEGRRQAINAINEEYGRYLPYMLSEKSSLEELREAYKTITDAIRNSLAVRMKSEAITEVTKDSIKKQSSSLMKMRENLRGQEPSFIEDLLGNIRDLTSESVRAGGNFGKIWGTVLGKVQDQTKGIRVDDSFYESIEDYVRGYIEYNRQIRRIEDEYSPFFDNEAAQKQVVKNREYWEEIRAQAQSSLDSIESDIKASLDKGFTSGIDKKTIEQYNSAISLLNKANEELKVYEKKARSTSNPYKTQSDALKSSQQLSQAVTQAEINLEQSRINLMAEGGEKEIAQLRLNHKKRMAEIDKQTAELIRKAREAEKAQWRQENPTAKESEFASKITGVEDLPTEFQNTIQQLINTENDLYKKSVQDYFDSVAKEFQGYLDKRKSIEEEFARKREALFKSGASSETIQESDYQEQEALKQVDLLFAQRERDFRVWASQITDMSLEELRNLLIKAQAELTKLEISEPDNGADLAKYRAMIIKIREEIDKIKGKESGGKTDTGEKDWAELYKVLTRVNDAFIDIGDSVGGVAGDIIKQAGSMTTSILQIVNSVKALQRGLEDLDRASVILAAISAGLKVVTGLFSIFNRTDYMKEFRNETAKLNEELRMLKENARIDSGAHDTIFGDDAWRNTVDNIHAANDALKEYNQTLEDIANRKYYSSFDSENGLWGDRDMDRGYIKEMKKDFDDAADSIANMQVQIRHSTWFRKAKYTSLKDAVPELFNEDDTINMTALDEFIDSDIYAKLSEQDKAYLQEMINNWHLYQDAVTAVNEYLTDIFGELGSSMMDALVDAFENGTDAAQAFTDSVSDMLEKLATNMIYSLTLGDLFEEAQQKAEEIMGNENISDEEMFKEMTDLMGWITDSAIEAQSDANKYLEAWKDIAAERGFDIFSPDEDVKQSQSGLSSSIQGVTEDTANLLGSYLNTIRQDVSVQRNVMENIGSNLLPTISITAQAQLQQLNAIAANTLANANAAQRIDEALSSVITTGSGGKAVRIK